MSIEANENDAKLKALEAMESKNVVKDTPKKNDSGLFLTGQWHDVDIKKLAHDGEFYRDNIRFKVQSASTQSIKYFSSMDEENPLVVQDAIQKIIENHVLCLDGNRKLDPLDEIHNFDRLGFVLLIALYTGTGNELKGEVLCGGEVGKHCNHKQTVKVNNQNLVFETPSEKARILFDKKKGIFNIKTKNLGDHKYRPLSLREDMEISQYTVKKYQDGDQIDKMFTDFAGFFMHKKTPNNTMDDIYNMYMKATSDINIISLYQYIMENDIKLEQKMELATNCEKCSRLGNNTIISIDKLRNIFFVPNINEEY